MIQRATMSPAPPIKLSSPETKEFWEIPVVFEDEHLLAINKPARFLTSPDRYDPNRPNLMKLLHEGIAAGKPWATARGVTYLANAHRLDFETTGVLLLAKNKPALVELANLFGTDKPLKTYIALVQGTPEADQFEVDAPLAPHPTHAGLMRVEPKRGKKSKTIFTVITKFRGYTLLKCQPLTGRTHQIRVHLAHLKHPILGDDKYGDFELNRSLRKLGLKRMFLHAASLTLPHPLTGEPLSLAAPLPAELERFRHSHMTSAPGDR